MTKFHPDKIPLWKKWEFVWPKDIFPPNFFEKVGNCPNFGHFPTLIFFFKKVGKCQEGKTFSHFCFYLKTKWENVQTFFHFHFFLLKKVEKYPDIKFTPHFLFYLFKISGKMSCFADILLLCLLVPLTTQLCGGFGYTNRLGWLSDDFLSCLVTLSQCWISRQRVNEEPRPGAAISSKTVIMKGHFSLILNYTPYSCCPLELLCCR